MRLDSGVVHAGFLRSVLRYPDRPALHLDGTTWSYGELDEAARCWAAALIEANGGVPRSVGVFGYQSPESYAGLLAAHYTGAMVVPLNWAFPVTRTRGMLAQARPDVLIVDDGAARQLGEVVAGLSRPPSIVAPLLDRSEVGDLPGARVLYRRDVASCGRLEELAAVDPSGAAHLFFAPGGPGTIKGVPIAHRNARHLQMVTAQRYRFGSADRVAQTIDQVLALGMSGIFSTWGAGGCLIPLKPLEILSPFTVVREREITVYLSVASMASSLYHKEVLTPGSLEPLRWSIFGGEPLSLTTTRAWQQAAPQTVVENIYGRTEVTGAFMTHRWDPEKSPERCVNGVLPLGRPHDGNQISILDGGGKPVLPGEEGELCVSGPQVFEGYWEDPDKSAEVLFTNDDPGGVSRTWYRTGDGAVALDEGEYAYLGRVDRPARQAGHRADVR